MGVASAFLSATDLGRDFRQEHLVRIRQTLDKHNGPLDVEMHPDLGFGFGPAGPR